jgi:hypothetical protein
MPEGRYIKSKETAKILGLKVGTLANMRTRGEGPPYIKKGRYLRYWEPDVLAWANKDRVIPKGKGEGK